MFQNKLFDRVEIIRRFRMAACHRVVCTALSLACVMSLYAASPTATNYSPEECQGSLRPYPVPEVIAEVPDSLIPVFVNHVGRHGSRFPASPSNTVKLAEFLAKADSAGTITPLGRDLLRLVSFVADVAHNRWGALDSLGMAEQRGIASRMFRNYPSLFDNGRVSAISSYSPRCVMSMYEFTHQLDRLNNHQEILTSAGRQNSSLMRPFDKDRDYLEWREQKVWEAPYGMQMATEMPAAPARRLVGPSVALSNELAQEISLQEYYVLAGMAAMGTPVDITKYMTREELNSAWSVFNLRQYLQRAASTLSSTPAEIAVALLLDLIETTDSAACGKAAADVCLRFGHAETLMPLLSLMRLRGCYYMTNYFDTVALHWCDFRIVPMAANLQMVLFRGPKNRMYVRFDLNERPIPLIPNSEEVYVQWDTARDYLLRCVPLHLRP